MFKKKCSRCGKRIGKKYEFCPYCGVDSRNNLDSEKDYGFLGKEDINDFGVKMPLGFNLLLKPLMKELNKQMNELNKELIKEEKLSKKSGNPMRTSFSIHIGIPGAKPIRLEGMTNGMNIGNLGQVSEQKVNIKLPKIKSETLSKIKSLPREEPGASVRRLADRVIYELILKGVKSLDNVNITTLEEGIEIKAVSDKKVFVKTIEAKMPFIGYSFAPEKLVLEFKL